MSVQLKQPNLSTTGIVNFCLKYARDVFSIPVKYPTAWVAWQNSNQRKDKNYPKDVAVPLWFSYFIGSENYGHVVIAVPNKGLYSSPYKSTQTHAVLSNISEIEAIYKCKYVGWSNDINEVAVAKITQSSTVSSMADKVSLEAGRILYYYIVGDKTALSGARDADIKKNAVGKDLTVSYLRSLHNAAETARNRSIVQKALEGTAALKDRIINLVKGA